MRTVTCHTVDCSNEGVPRLLDLVAVDDETGETRPVDSVECGVCHQPITDIQPG